MLAKRIYQIAKTLSVKGVDIVHYLRDQGFDVKSHMVVASPEMLDSIEKKYKPAEATAKKKVAKKSTASEAPEAQAAVKKATKVEKPAVRGTKAETAPVAAGQAAPAKKAAVQVVKKRDHEVAESPEVPAAEAEAVAVEAPVRETPPPPPKPEEKPRVIRYAPGMEPGARTDTSTPPSAGGDSRGQDFQIRSRPRRTGPGGGPGSGPVAGTHAGGQRQIGSARTGPPPSGDAQPQRGRKRRKKKGGPDEQEIKRSVRQTMASMDVKGGAKKRRRTVTKGGVTEELTIVEEPKLRILPLSSLSELANAMKVPETEVIATCLRSGLMVTMNQRLEMEDIELIATEYEFEVEFISEYEDAEAQVQEEIPEDELSSRGPVVTVMGHVDHGKTKLLDYIRSANVADHEAGAITQHIGAYSVSMPGGLITFLDTPGHEAFTAMRARGTTVTDIVIIVVAADDGVMPQTVEAIDHAKAAGVPIIIAVNKIDLPAANPGKVKQELLQHNVTVEDFGGDVVAVPISAKLGTGIDKLLEMVLFQAEMLNLKGAADRKVKASVIEAKKDPGRGVVFTALVQQGTLKVGLPFNVGLHFGTVRALVDEWGDRMTEVGPGIPVEILGAGGVPEAGDLFTEAESDVKAREISNKRQQLRREQEIRYQRRVTLDELYIQISKGEIQELKLVLKGDVSGSVEAMADNFQKLSTDEVKVQVLHKSVGTINESDIILAAASGAIIIGFNVRPQVSVRDMAKREHVEIRTYDIIYEAVDEVKKAMSGLLKPFKKEIVQGSAEVRQVFKVPRIGSIAGCHVIDGTIERSSQIRVLRDGVIVNTRKISSLKRFKEDVGKVESGFECGIGLADFQDVKEGDILEAFIIEEIARSL